MISSGGAVVDGTRASHVAPALSFPPHHPLYPPAVPEFLRPPLPSRYRHPGVSGGGTAASSQQPIVPVSSATSPLAVARSLSKEDEDYSYRFYSYPYPYSPYLYPLVRPIDFSYTSPPHSPLVNNTTGCAARTVGKPVQIVPPPPGGLGAATLPGGTTALSVHSSSRGAGVTGTTSLPPPVPSSSCTPSSTSSSSSLSSSTSTATATTTTTVGAAKEPLKSRLLRKRSRAGPSASFARGSLIRLASGELRRVEEMRTEDFITSAEACPALRLDPSTVVRIDSPPDSPTATLTLSYGQNRSQTEVECTSDHPYFVYGQGWASCRPDRTLASYGLKVHQLQVGDVCISLTPRIGVGGCSSTTSVATSFGGHLINSSASINSALIAAAHCSGAPLLDRKRRWSAPDEIHDLPPPPIAHQQPAKD